jgi:hypothetical protein
MLYHPKGLFLYLNFPDTSLQISPPLSHPSYFMTPFGFDQSELQCKLSIALFLTKMTEVVEVTLVL